MGSTMRGRSAREGSAERSGLRGVRTVGGTTIALAALLVGGGLGSAYTISSALSDRDGQVVTAGPSSGSDDGGDQQIAPGEPHLGDGRPSDGGGSDGGGTVVIDPVAPSDGSDSGLPSDSDQGTDRTGGASGAPGGDGSSQNENPSSSGDQSSASDADRSTPYTGLSDRVDRHGAGHYANTETLLEDGSISYTIQWGDTLSEISEHYGVSMHEVARANGIENLDLIYAETEMIIPGEKLVIPPPAG